MQDQIMNSATAAATVSASSLALTFLQGVGLQQIFEIVQVLQIVVILPLLSTNMPANTGMFFSVLQMIAAFDVFEIGEYVDEYLELTPEDPINEKFETIGMESKYYINNMGSFFLTLVFEVLLIIVYLLLVPFASKSKCIKRRVKNLNKKLFWNSWVVTVT